MKPEQQLVHQVMTWLALRNILAYRTRNTGTIIHGPRGVVFGRDRYFRQQRGCADILVWKDGKAWAFELKAPNGRVSPEQSEWLQRFAAAGGTACVVRSLEEVAAALWEKI